MIKYRNRVLVVEHKGKIIHRFKSIKKLQAHNRIEGYLNFYGSASPSGRVFPGYGKFKRYKILICMLTAIPVIRSIHTIKSIGFLRVGRRGVAQYVQTIVDPVVCAAL